MYYLINSESSIITFMHLAEEEKLLNSNNNNNNSELIYNVNYSCNVNETYSIGC